MIKTRLTTWQTLRCVRGLLRCFPVEHARLQREVGDVLWLGSPVHSIFGYHPDLVEHVLVKRADNYRKSDTYAGVKPVFGEGLVTANGERWKTSRRALQPNFTRAAAAEMAPLVVQSGDRLVHRWRPRDGQVVDVNEDFSELLLEVFAEVLLGDDVGASARALHDHLHAWELNHLARAYALINLPLHWPMPSHQRMRRGLAAVDGLVADLVSRAREYGPRQGKAMTLLHHLLELQRSQPEAFGDQQVRDEVLTLLLAGHDTTALTMTWCLSLLARHTAIQADVHAEIDAVLRGGQPSLEQPLPLLMRVIEETLRLYPAVPGFSRASLTDDDIAGVSIPAGTRIELSPYATHRHAAFFSHPDRFDPDRFLEPSRRQWHPGAYFPFARGPRMCIGREVAVVQVSLLLAQVLQAFSVQTVVADEPALMAGVSLKPKHGMPLRIIRRSS